MTRYDHITLIAIQSKGNLIERSDFLCFHVWVCACVATNLSLINPPFSKLLFVQLPLYAAVLQLSCHYLRDYYVCATVATYVVAATAANMLHVLHWYVYI